MFEQPIMDRRILTLTDQLITPPMVLEWSKMVVEAPGLGTKFLKRVIARLDIKSDNLIKGVQLEGLRVVGKPKDFAIDYFKAGIDELLYMDVVASLYGRNSLLPLLERTVEEVFIQ